MHIQQTWGQTVATTYTGLRVLFCLTLQAPILIQISVMSGNAAQAAGGAAGPPTKVLCLMNIVAPEELVDEEEYDGNVVILAKLFLHWKWSFWQLVVQAVMENLIKITFRFREWTTTETVSWSLLTTGKLFHERVRPDAHIPQWTSPISQDAPFCNKNVHVCAYSCYKILHCGIYLSNALWDLWDGSWEHVSFMVQRYLTTSHISTSCICIIHQLLTLLASGITWYSYLLSWQANSRIYLL